VRESEKRVDKDILSHLHGVARRGHVQQTGTVDPVRELCGN
jgi:hypothetical protein